MSVPTMEAQSFRQKTVRINGVASPRSKLCKCNVSSAQEKRILISTLNLHYRRDLNDWIFVGFWENAFPSSTFDIEAHDT